MKKYGVLLLVVFNFYVYATPNCLLPKHVESCSSILHPFYVDVEIFNYNATSQTFEVTLRIFMDDAQKILEQYLPKADLYNEKDTAIVKQFYEPYIKNNLHFLCNGKLLPLEWIGYERENGIVLFYLESMPIANPKDIQVQSTLLCGYFNQSHIIEIHINHMIRNSKLDCRNSIFKTQF